MTLAERIRRARKHAKLTQDALAKRVGISQPTLSDLERGEIAGTSYIVPLARATGVHAAWLAEERGQMHDPEDAQSATVGLLDQQSIPDWIELARSSPLIPSNSMLLDLLRFHSSIRDAHRNRSITDATYELVVAALQAQLAGISEHEVAPVRQILQNIIEAKRPKTTPNQGIDNTAVASKSELDRKARAAIASAIPGNIESESEDATTRPGEKQRKRR